MAAPVGRGEKNEVWEEIATERWARNRLWMESQTSATAEKELPQRLHASVKLSKFQVLLVTPLKKEGFMYVVVSICIKAFDFVGQFQPNVSEAVEYC